MKTRNWLVLVLLLAVCRASLAEPMDLGFDLDKHLGKDWYGIYLGGKKSGHAVATAEKLKLNGKDAYKFAMDVSMTISILGNAQQLELKEHRIFYASGELAECFSSIGPQSYLGKVNGDTMTIIANVGEVENRKTVPAPAVTLKDEVAPLRLIFGKPKIGDSVKTLAYSPILGKDLTGVVTVTGKRKMFFGGAEISVYEVNTTIEEMGVESPSLVSEEGELLQMTFPLGTMKMVLKLEGEERAKDPSVEAVEMLDASTIRPTGKVPLGARTVKIRITGLNDERCIINNDRQAYRKLGDGSYEVTLSTDVLPSKRRTLPISDPEFEEYTAPTELYQSKHPDIVKKAREIVGEMKDSARVAQAICLWVFANLDKRGTASYSNSLETLKSMKGDCSEHAALFVGLCRAVGLPARVANGIAYTNSIGGFGGHAWGEVYVGKWISVDPTFGEPIAGPLRIKFAGDSLLQTGRLLKLIGEMKIEFVADEK